MSDREKVEQLFDELWPCPAPRSDLAEQVLARLAQSGDSNQQRPRPRVVPPLPPPSVRPEGQTSGASAGGRRFAGRGGRFSVRHRADLAGRPGDHRAGRAGGRRAGHDQHRRSSSGRHGTGGRPGLDRAEATGAGRTAPRVGVLPGRPGRQVPGDHAGGRRRGHRHLLPRQHGRRQHPVSDGHDGVRPGRLGEGERRPGWADAVGPGGRDGAPGGGTAPGRGERERVARSGPAAGG